MSNPMMSGRASPGPRSRGSPTPTGDREGAGSPTDRMRPKMDQSKTMPLPAFSTCTDYSKMNEQRHNGHRSDTFGTPQSLNVKYHIASGRRKGLSDTDYLIDVCEQAFQKSFQHLRCVQEEMRDSIDSIRKDLNDTMEEQHLRAKLLVEVMEVTQDIHQAFQKPIIVELAPVQEELQRVMSSALQGHNMMQGLEDRLSQKMSQMIDCFDTLQKRQEEFHGQHLVQIKDELKSVKLKDMQDSIKRSEDQLSEVARLTQSLSAASTAASKGVIQLHEESKCHHAKTNNDFLQIQEIHRQQQTDLYAFVEIQFGKHVKQTPVNVDFKEVMEQILKTQYVVETDFDSLLNEIAKIQQAMNTDFTRVVPDENSFMPRFSQAAKVLSEKERRKFEIETGYEQRKMAIADRDDEDISEETDEPTMHGAMWSMRPEHGDRPPLPTDVPEEPLRLKRSTLHNDLEAVPKGTDSMSSMIDTFKTAAMKRGTKIFGKRERVRVRDFWTQTDAGHQVEVWVQTCEALMPKPRVTKRIKRGKDLVQPPPPPPPKVVKPGKVFGDAQEMKKRVRANLMQPQYDVSDLYHRKGCFQAVARSSIFENLNFFVIFLNAIWIAVDTDHNDAAIIVESHPVFQVGENFFCAYFAGELFIRFMAFKRKLSCLRDKWFVFDALLVFFMVADTWVFTIVMLSQGWTSNNTEFLRESSILRIARLAKVIRMTRMAKLMRAIPELVVLCRGLVIAFRSVLVFILLWVVLVFVFGILFRQITDGDEIGNRYFKTVPAAMNTLLLNGLLPEIESFVRELGDNVFLWILIMIFIILGSLTIMHMLVGVLVELVSAISVAEKEGMQVGFISSELRRAMTMLDVDLTSRLSKLQFQKLLAEPAISGIIHAAGADVISLLDMSDVIFEDLQVDETSGLSFENLVEIVLNMRGTNTATVKDVKAQLKIIKAFLKEATASMMEELNHEFQSVKSQLAMLTEASARILDNQSDGDEDSIDSEDSACSSQKERTVGQELPGGVADLE